MNMMKDMETIDESNEINPKSTFEMYQCENSMENFPNSNDQPEWHNTTKSKTYAYPLLCKNLLYRIWFKWQLGILQNSKNRLILPISFSLFPFSIFRNERICIFHCGRDCNIRNLEFRTNLLWISGSIQSTLDSADFGQTSEILQSCGLRDGSSKSSGIMHHFDTNCSIILWFHVGVEFRYNGYFNRERKRWECKKTQFEWYFCGSGEDFNCTSWSGDGAICAIFCGIFGFCHGFPGSANCAYGPEFRNWNHRKD